MAKGGKQPGAGRPKGSPNKTTASAKESIERAFEAMGGQTTFVEWAKANKSDFYRMMYTKLLPKDINANVKGDIQIVIAPHEAEY